MEQLLSKLSSVEDRFQEIEGLLAKPEVASDYEQVQRLAKERASLEGMVTMYREYRGLLQERSDVLAILDEGAEHEMTALARQGA